MATAGPHAVDFAISGPITRSDLPGLCERLCAALTRSGAELARCNVSGADPDAVTVDALARLQLAARRCGCRVRLCNTSVALAELVELMGLKHVFADESVAKVTRV
jgi:ABC-type transporter Mla MlaB component